MREIIHLQVGQCGNQVGMKFWDIIANEHGISSSGYFVGDSDLEIQGIQVYFSESTTGRFIPRAILVDMEPSVLDKIRNTKYGNIFRPDNFISGVGGASNNWARGFYSDGADLLDNVLDVLRKEAENCENIQGFQLLHSTGGGTGSGFGSLLLSKLADEFPDRIICSYTVFPSPQISDVVVEPYNSMLTFEHLISTADETFVLDNEALYNICSRVLKLEKPVYADLNHLISVTLSGVTTSLRFTGQLNADLRKLATNLVPFQRFHFFITAFAPLSSRFTQKYQSCSVHELVLEAFDCRNLMVACDPTKGKYIAVAAMFRGKMSMRDIDLEIYNFQNKNSSFFVDWIPNNVKTSSCDVPPKGFKNSVTFIGNSTSIQDTFARIIENYVYMYRRKAYLHWYTDEGMEEQEFQEAERSILDLIEDYQRLEIAKACENATANDEDSIHENVEP